VSEAFGQRYLRSLRRGVLWGAWFSGGFSLIALILVGLEGGGTAGLGLPLHKLLMTYWVLGPSGGLIVGLLSPLGRWALGWAFIGALVGALTWTVFALQDTGRPPARADVVVGAILGVVGGLVLWQAERSLSRRGF
jgi:hypothetical protein